MGLLDDAIKEHLDLKRRRGADPAEVERAEREALGPVRRNREAPVASESDDDQDAGGIAYDQADDEDWSYDEAAERLEGVPADESELPPLELSADDIVEAPRPRSAEPETAPAPAPAPAPEPTFDETAFEESAFEEPAFEDEPAPAPPPSFAHGARGAETAEYDVEEAIAGDEDESGEDMLEETPEFLQDTPDHDRLWFEQRPPKDFDFDG
jgi:hypothetical protein